MTTSSFPQIDRYQIRQGLGRGAMGSVYLAYDPKMARDVAVKVLEREYARSSKHRERFDREAKAIAALQHPNIVELFDYGGSPDEYLFLVMELIRGPHMGKFCREHGVFPETVLTAVGMELAAALGHAHKAGIIHRDLKPENVFIDGGRLVLADFGITKAIAEENPFGPDAASRQTDIIGTPGFMAPEQLNQTVLDGRTDIFAFGALLYYLGSNKLPYDAESPYGLLQVFQETRPAPLNDLRPEISEQLSRLLQECLEVRPEIRPPSAEAVWQRLRDNLESLGAREPREILADFEADPARFRAVDRSRVVAHLVGRLKIAVRDQDGIAADEIRIRLSVLDPENAEAIRVTGIQPLLENVRRPSLPEAVIARSDKRRWLVIGVVAALIALAGAFSFLSQRTLPVPGAQPARQITMLKIRATDRTHVFLDGRALGSTPNFPPAMVPSGHATLEFVHDRRGRMVHDVELAPGATLTLIVDWKHRRVREPKAKGKKKG